MILVADFDFGKAAGLELLILLKKTYSSYFLRLKWRTAFFQTPLNVYFWMNNERLNNAQSLASWPIYTYSKSTAVQYNTRSSDEIFLKLTINASQWRQYCHLGTNPNLNWHFYCENEQVNDGTIWLAAFVELLSFKINLKFTYLYIYLYIYIYAYFLFYFPVHLMSCVPWVILSDHHHGVDACLMLFYDII